MTRFKTFSAATVVAIAAAISGSSAYGYVEENLPTAADISRQAPPAQPQDHRSADARDTSPAAKRLHFAGPSETDTAVTPSGDGFEWGDAGLGAALMLGLLSLCGGTAVLIRRRRHYSARMT